MDSISLFLEKDILSEEKSEVEKIRSKAPQFWLSEDRKLYKRSFSGPYLLCVHPEASESLLVKKCDQCQRFVPNIHQPGGVLNPLSSSCPFAQ